MYVSSGFDHFKVCSKTLICFLMVSKIHLILRMQSWLAILLLFKFKDLPTDYFFLNARFFGWYSVLIICPLLPGIFLHIYSQHVREVFTT